MSSIVTSISMKLEDLIGWYFDPLDLPRVRRLARELVGENYTIYYPKVYRYTNSIRNFIIVITNTDEPRNYGMIIALNAGAHYFNALLRKLKIRHLRLIIRRTIRIRFERFTERILEIYEYREGDKKAYVLWFYHWGYASGSIERIINGLTRRIIRH